MKKRFIAIGLVVILAVSLTVFAVIKFRNAKSDEPATVPFQNAQLGVTVDGWLKVIEINEYNGVLAVVAENVSDSDVEYAVLTVKTKTNTLTFTVSVMLKGMKAVLLCNESVACDPSEVYTAWQIKDKILFESSPVMNEDKLEVILADGSISVKNISGEDIESDIVICYKDKKDDLLNGSVTYRTRLKGLKAGSKTFIKASEHNAENCQIIFTDYDS
ncbi:MAG: hypothetical protein J6R20_06620 [Clostridia bacterium]|nr:hypothetical protein [Clostridia bacterium]